MGKSNRVKKIAKAETNDRAEVRDSVELARVETENARSEAAPVEAAPVEAAKTVSAPYLATDETIAIARKRYAERKGNDRAFAGNVLVSDTVTFNVTPEIAAPLAFDRTGIPSKSRARKVNGYREVGATISVAEALKTANGLNSLDLRWDYGRGFITIRDANGKELIGNPARDRYAKD